jgi:diguanylate cyclase (GGDEF)-like protein
LTTETAILERERDRVRLSSLERLDRRLKLLSILISILLTFAVISLAIRVSSSETDIPFRENLQRSSGALLGIVVLFNVYAVYQQFLLSRIRRKLNEEVTRAGEFEIQTLLDPLTGLYNRRAADRRLGEEIARSVRLLHSMTVLALDLDGFKKINGVYGHSVGDLALKAFAARLQKAVRFSDVPIRFGGDEFMVILPECRGDQVKSILNRLSTVFFEVEGKEVPILFSSGYAILQPGESPKELMDRADLDLYSNKKRRQLVC